MNQEYKMKLSKEQFVNIYNNEYLQGSSVVSLDLFDFYQKQL